MLDHISRLGVPELNIGTKTRSQLVGHVNFFGEFPIDHPWEPMLDHVVIVFFGGGPLLVRTREPMLDHVVVIVFF
ncbi:hypothetical protein PF001_g10153 [Phytophthora fragariae]|uniref:Uncharacterized protein n=1 Tax=Phytophthora fragariae TaxID=53985 RepID=A0A6A4DLC4_9STRA|nr:hypothetical protein PF001_g10153 [Phytophthora fragariae]